MQYDVAYCILLTAWTCLSANSVNFYSMMSMSVLYVTCKVMKLYTVNVFKLPMEMILANMIHWVGALGVVAMYLHENNFFRKSAELKVPRTVGLQLPFVGNGLLFSTDIMGYVRECVKNYGKIFTIKIYRKTMTVITDRTFVGNYFKQTENNMSLYQALKTLYFADAFSDDANSLPTIIALVKGTISIKYETFIPKIKMEAEKMITRMKKLHGQKTDITTEMIRFVAFTSAQCFIAMELSEEFYGHLVEFTNLLNQIVVMTYFLPKWVLRKTIGMKLSGIRKKMTNLLNDEIEKYRADSSKEDSLVFRRCVDHYKNDGNEKLTNQEIGDIIICLLYVSSENTALGLSNSLISLAQNPLWWERVKMTSAKILAKGNMRELFGNEVINACVMESARTTTHIFPLNRTSMKDGMSLNGYVMDNVDTVALCEPMLMRYECAEDIYKNADIYNPGRFIGEKKEKLDPKSLMTWGSGPHLCPGREFALMEIKTGVALVTNYFERFNIDPLQGNKLNYFSPSAFAEIHADIKVMKISDADNEIYKEEKKLGEKIQKIHDERKKEVVVEMFDGGWLLRDFLELDEQINLYKSVVESSKGSKEHDEIKGVSGTKPYPITYYNLVYTKTSNCAKPTMCLELGEKIWQLLTENDRQLKFTGRAKKPYGFDSVYAQLYDEKSTMNVHKDEHVDWGVSINLGASCEFVFGQEKIILNSGDILVSDFSKIDHGVSKIIMENIPKWFTAEAEDPTINTFGRARCSIQVRSIGETTASIDREEFLKMINK
ncbi:MAG: putative lanosterol 14-alpha demethylase [Harvfovirus sp.]|uniref:Putative lanosterol 14-alpha demethylase n=1 Tax=Harvfovirus sp. TaxID=2487768 RepID=A0A3G5A3J0_9VIRU|nr:MAG: putative lanosterol 14-alpha demethylase [Harvfovirus sp.]